MRISSRRLSVLSALTALLILGSSAAAQVTVFQEKFTSGNANGWTLGTEWQIGAAVASAAPPACSFFGDPGIDADGTVGGGIAGVVIGGNASVTTTHPARYLTSPVIALPTGSTATLSFARWLNSDYAPFMTSTVEVFDGTNWAVVYSTGSSGCVTDGAWSTQTYDVSLYANPNFRVRFGFAIGSPGAFQTSSWNVDNVKVTALPNETLINGSFETTYPSANLTLITVTSTAGCGWNVVSGNYEVLGTSFWPPSDGTRSIDLNGNIAGAISTQAQVLANKSYAILWDLGANPSAPPTSQVTVNITFDAGFGVAAVSNVYQASSVGNSATVMNWSRKGLSFSTTNALTATGTMTVKFTSNTSGGSGPALDNVRLVPLDVVANGSFEVSSPAIPVPGILSVAAGSNMITSWNVTSGNVDLDAGVNSTASAGAAAIDMNGTSAGEIQQTVYLRRNRSYRVDFDLAGNVIQPGLKTIEVSLTPIDISLSPVVRTYTFDSTGFSVANMGWTQQTLIISTEGADAAAMAATLKFKSLTGGASGPYIDNVRLTMTNSGGTSNNSNATLIVNGTGTTNSGGPWAEGLTATSGLTLSWQGPANMPFILLGSTVDSFHTPISNFGTLDLGDPANVFSDIFIIFDGTTFPGFYFYVLDSTGNATTNYSTYAMPPGTEFSIQGLVVQTPTSTAPYRFTAAHHLLRY